ncbi:integrin-linked protein kinase 1-like [Phoenix dactylifera]|uniref:Integrin-linked protein kinase 1-like n=1 Tax=Phoenix dactylifera TaxID=42345 RepID=A0A8B9AGS9_PHODC|nr:integrin-linked protein kinase 1-like [Phoenix dactylifera]
MRQPRRRSTREPSSFGGFQQSSLALRPGGPPHRAEYSPTEIESTVDLMYLAGKGDGGGIRGLLESDIVVNFKGIDGRTALHVTAFQGRLDVVDLLLLSGAVVDPRHRNTSLLRFEVEHIIASMHVKMARKVPDYGFHPSELDFTNSVEITKCTCLVQKTFGVYFDEAFPQHLEHFATWLGIEVAVKMFNEDVITDKDKMWVDLKGNLDTGFHCFSKYSIQILSNFWALQSNRMMAVMEYLPKQAAEGSETVCEDRPLDYKNRSAFTCPTYITSESNMK